jgi:hypothetical protein
LLFEPRDVPPGTTATRFALLSESGLPAGAEDRIRAVVNLCQKSRFAAGRVSQGDAIEALRAAKEAAEAAGKGTNADRPPGP